jgi:NifU-like protein involved in Fe-S cluster formation
MVSPQLRALIADASGSGALTGAAFGRGRGEHPVCGDAVEVDVRLLRGRIHELRWRAQGCPACFAVAAAAALALPGAEPDRAGDLLRAALAARGDLAADERHAEAMFLRALSAAVAAVPPPS